MSNDATGDLFVTAIHKVLELLPKDGDKGEFPCPACGIGEIRWLRVGKRRHLRIGCTTPECVMLIQ
jgi:predicted RNA-binding Zn-ribbon protein involved in translation (DUF1610 family)